MTMDTQTEIHNRAVGEVFRAIVEPPLRAGGDFSDVVVILESVVLGVVIMGERFGWDGDGVLDELILRVKERLAKAQRPAGSVN